MISPTGQAWRTYGHLNKIDLEDLWVPLYDRLPSRTGYPVSSSELVLVHTQCEEMREVRREHGRLSSVTDLKFWRSPTSLTATTSSHGKICGCGCGGCASLKEMIHPQWQMTTFPTGDAASLYGRCWRSPKFWIYDTTPHSVDKSLLLQIIPRQNVLHFEVHSLAPLTHLTYFFSVDSTLFLDKPLRLLSLIRPST